MADANESFGTVRTPTLAEVIRVAIAARLLDVHVSMPAKVEAYDASKGSVEVTPLLMFPRVDDAGNVTMQALPKQVGVPVVFPGGGGARMTFPIKAGDFVTLVFADRSIDVWKGNASGTPVDPGVDSSHALADAVAIPGLRALSKPWSGADPAAVTIGTDGAAFQGSGLGHALRAELDLLWAAIATHLHGPGNTPAVTGPAGDGTTAYVTTWPTIPSVSNPNPNKQTVESASVKVSP